MEGQEGSVSVNRHGGKRRGSGRKRTYESGYENLRSVIWKTISIHAEIYDEWISERTRHGYKDNSGFAQLLLDSAKNTTVSTAATSVESDNFGPTATANMSSINRKERCVYLALFENILRVKIIIKLSMLAVFC